MSTSARQSNPRLVFSLLVGSLVLCVTAATAVIAQGKREFAVSARKYAFKVNGSNTPEIHVAQGDLVHVDFTSEDIPHAFTIDDPHYRIMRRAEAGKPVSFDFRADQPGKFRFYCSLTADEKCKDMQGTLIVDPRP